MLGAVQGLGEFLPVSSSGHLILFQRMFELKQDLLLFDILLHCATLLAICIVMRKEIISLISHPFQKSVGYIVLSVIPTVIIALIFECYFESLISGLLLPVCFAITGVLLVAQWMQKTSKKEGFSVLNKGKAIACGLVQGIAVLPGISRSGATVSTLCLMGVNREEAVRFSFLMSIPVIIGSVLLEGLKMQGNIGVTPACLIAGCVSAFVFGFASLRFMLNVFTKKGQLPFAVYMFAVSLLSIFIG
ncbi:MAG: undecaprenyl-diphosphate phosphatase [Clostridia bacterium]|nr:undecaprenyl-diphosphate phosphatase [Clostridia bacterium]